MKNTKSKLNIISLKYYYPFPLHFNVYYTYCWPLFPLSLSTNNSSGTLKFRFPTNAMEKPLWLKSIIIGNNNHNNHNDTWTSFRNLIFFKFSIVHLLLSCLNAQEGRPPCKTHPMLTCLLRIWPSRLSWLQICTRWSSW